MAVKENALHMTTLMGCATSEQRMASSSASCQTRALEAASQRARLELHEAHNTNKDFAHLSIAAMTEGTSSAKSAGCRCTRSATLSSAV